MTKLKSAIITMAIIAMATTATAQQAYITKAGFIAAATKPVLKRAVSYIVVKDYESLARMIESKKIIFMKSGAPVYIEDREFLKGMIQIRPVGEDWAMWTVTEAVE